MAALQERLRAVAAGSDAAARREHLRVAAALTLTVAVGAGVVRVGRIVVSPVVWDAFFLLAAVALLSVTAANAYWRGGLLAGYALVFGPVAAGLLVAHAGSGAFDALARTVGFGLVLVSVVAVVLGSAGYAVGSTARLVRDRGVEA